MTYEPGQAELQKACPLTFSESQKLDLLVAPHSSMHKNQNLYIYIQHIRPFPIIGKPYLAPDVFSTQSFRSIHAQKRMSLGPSSGSTRFLPAAGGRNIDVHSAQKGKPLESSKIDSPYLNTHP